MAVAPLDTGDLGVLALERHKDRHKLLLGVAHPDLAGGVVPPSVELALVVNGQGVVGSTGDLGHVVLVLDPFGLLEFGDAGLVGRGGVEEGDVLGNTESGLVLAHAQLALEALAPSVDVVLVSEHHGVKLSTGDLVDLLLSDIRELSRHLTLHHPSQAQRTVLPVPPRVHGPLVGQEQHVFLPRDYSLQFPLIAEGLDELLGIADAAVEFFAFREGVVVLVVFGGVEGGDDAFPTLVVFDHEQLLLPAS